jgi:F0F1-type ATP synthase membrane subunit b/b'
MSDAQLYLRIAIWSQVISSVVFIAVLVLAWFRWFLPVIMSAQERSNKQIAEAERHRDEVKAALETLSSEIGSARHDAELIVQRAKEHAEHERQSVLEECKDAGERALRDAGKELGRARVAAQRRLRDDLLARALRVAREDAARRVSPALDERLIDGFVGSLERARG